MTPPLIKPLIFVLALAPLAFADFNCQGGSFLSATVLGKTPDKAREKAKAEIARNIISNIKSNTKMTDYSEERNGVMREASTFLETSEIESSLTLFGFQEAEPPKRQKNGEYELKVYICTKDAAKSFLEKQRLVADSLRLASSTVLNTKHPKHKNEALRKAQMLWGEFIRTRSLLEVLGVEDHYPEEEIYSKAIDDYRNYCKNAKLHWNPEKETPYSEMAFSKLSGSIKIEKSPCKGRGISLAYKGSEPECTVKFGLSTCAYVHSLSVDACDGTEYLQLKNDTTGAHQKPDFALEKLHNNLKSAEFWNQWINEIKLWSPQCE